ncbi:OPT oligopeptide transporter protein-domain-containing protein [Calycina marina]|uniref:OPT oligopeptide transporter protein-domain-containing protein n=1 Tax=Calycina marina TaxID=1763456 RepID=A0A9P7Z9U4_9HELO|nr:OPT oligopeptide transporter protein-domain-containing protein [Calycina marina]
MDTGITSGVSVGDDTDDQALNLQKFQKMHKWDLYMDADQLNTVDNVLASGDIEKEAALEQSILEENSPYSEVRASVPATDDPTLHTDTVRAWFLGLVICTIVGGCNVLLTLRPESLSIPSTVVQLIAYPCGTFLARVLPSKPFTVFGKQFTLNPGPFNMKEHTLIVVMAAAGTSVSYAIDILLAQEVFYGFKYGWGYQLLLTMSTQALGFGVAGITRRFLVWPAAMVWPTVLVSASVMVALHDHSKSDPSRTNGWKIGRYKFFLLVSGVYFLYAWFPSFIAPFLSFFCFAVWAAPNNVIVNQLLGGQTNIGLIPITFDWSIVAGFTGSPLYVPAFALVNNVFGLLIVMLAAIGMVFAGPELYKYFPISANSTFDNTANSFNTSRVVSADFTLDEAAYRDYSPLIIGPTFAMAYGMSFATLSSIIVHVGLYNGKELWQRMKLAKNQDADIHLKLMRKYREAPEWWFMGTFLISFAFAMAASQHWETHLAWWALIFSIFIGVIFFVPIAMIYAITANAPGLNVITEFIIGYLQPGKPLAMMMFKSYGYMMQYNALTYSTDMKLGHYMKVPPRSMFRAQFVAVFWLSIVQIASYNFLIGNIANICTADAAASLTCPNAKTFFNASVIWGLVGPRRMFGPGSLYSWVHYFWLIGAGSTFVGWLVARKYPRTWVRYIYFPAVWSASGMIPPATCYKMMCYIVVGLLFNWLVRRKWPNWWSTYNYTMSAALDIGNAICAILIVLILGFSNTSMKPWWGVTVVSNNLDAEGAAVSKTLGEGETIGPAYWS